MNEFNDEKNAASLDLLNIRSKCDDYKKELSKLLKKSNSIKKKMKNAILLGVSAEEYDEVMDVLGQYSNQDIMNEILKKNV